MRIPAEFFEKNNNNNMKHISITILVFIFSFICFAQQNNTEDAILNSLNSQNFTETPNNFAFIEQSGLANIAFIYQSQTSFSGTNNAEILQDGNLNAALLYQQGYGLTSIVRQVGNNNYADIDLIGNDLDIEVNQIGDNNSVNQTVFGNELNYTVIQEGSNNSFNHYENGGDQSVPFEIQQKGNGIETIIITN